MNTPSIRRPAVSAFVALATAVLIMAVVDVRYRRHRYAPVRSYVQDNVPGAAELFHTSGRFVRSSTGALTTQAIGAVDDSTRPALAANAPATADAPFEIAVPGGSAHLALRFLDVAASKVELDDGAAVYRNVQPGIDLIALHDPERLELAYMVDSLPASPHLAFQVDLHGGALRREPTTDALLVVDEAGRARFRIGRPIAVDARGVHRAGSYSFSGGAVTIAMRWEGLTPPLVIDPAITIPFWSIVADGRGPGSLLYDATSLSRETHAVMDTARGRTVVIRPVRSEQPEDTIFQFGDASRDVHEAQVQRIAAIPRLPGLAGLFAAADAAADFKRSFSLASETWEWDGATWSLRDTATLPGVIDPAMAFDGKRARTVLYGGASPGLGCIVDTAFGTVSGSTPFYCKDADRQDVTYEYDGVTWTAKAIAGSPPPRVRAAMAWDERAERVVLFGGRELDTSDFMRKTDPYGAIFPENFTRGLLNDTWTYDGTAWTRVATGTPPPAVESAQLVYDRARKVSVLIGGHAASDSAGASDLLSVWEFDGTDWTQRLRAGDVALSPSLRTRRGATAFWNESRGRVTIFGGQAAKLDSCALTDAEITARVTATASDPPGREALAATGCLGGYLHDVWEWDGRAFAQVGAVAYGGSIGGQYVFRQLTGGTTWTSAGTAPPIVAAATTTGTPLLPWRHDQRAAHFEPRTTLERAHYAAPAGTAGVPDAAGVVPAASGAVVSPLFASAARPELVFDPRTATATLFTPDDAGIYRFDGAAWSDLTPKATPFSTGPSDFFGATWDTNTQHLVLFDPRTGVTWTFVDATGWTRLTPPTSPPRWSLDPKIRAKCDLDPPRGGPAKANDGAALATATRQMPHMTFDRTRGLVVMLYAGATWEFDGASWSSRPLPTGWSSCVAGVNVAFDGARSKTVAFGCGVPASTWEWDGVAWAGPFGNPYIASVWRDRGDLVTTPFDYLSNWQGTLQAAWTHPNAAFESTRLGGVSMIDADGTVRTWNGTAWVSGPAIAEGYTCFVSSKPGSTSNGSRGLRFLETSYPWPIDDTTLIGKDYLPLCFFPPVVEDLANQRLLAMRDGPRGMLQATFPASGPPVWGAAPLGQDDQISPTSSLALTTVHPYPFELLSAEHGYFKTQTDPASRKLPDGSAPHLPADSSRVLEKRIPNLWWPYRIFSDPITKRVRFLTNRGVLWELGGETLHTLGGSCVSNLDCVSGSCTSEGVCCDVATCGAEVCTTCKGTVPGHCEILPAGAPEPLGRCGAGECGGTCAGGAKSCAYDGTRACGPATSCAGAVLTPRGHCSPLGASCVTADTVASTCPLVGGIPDTTVTTLDPITGYRIPCVVPPRPCDGALACASPTACKTTCASRLDCTGRFADCTSAGTACAPDRASTLATAMGVTPVTTELPPLYTQNEVAAVMTDGGMATDDAGRVILRDISFGATRLAFDPSLHTPVNGLRKCLDRVLSTIMMNNSASIDACVASVPRCVGATPWLGDDPGGEDCCPEPCLEKYFEARATKPEGKALDVIGTSGCYPTDEVPDGGAP